MIIVFYHELDEQVARILRTCTQISKTFTLKTHDFITPWFYFWELWFATSGHELITFHFKDILNLHSNLNLNLKSKSKSKLSSTLSYICCNTPAAYILVHKSLFDFFFLHLGTVSALAWWTPWIQWVFHYYSNRISVIGIDRFQLGLHQDHNIIYTLFL